MLVVQISTVPGGQGCVPAGPAAATLILPAGSAGMAAVHVELPEGRPGSDPGTAEIVLISLCGTAELRHEDGHDGPAVTLLAGRAAYITRGERVSLTNPGSEPASVMVIASPPEFAGQLATWPAA
ncbi:MAG: cupin domain-containing protein [Streptosporangiaceae bacterium]